MTAKVINTYTNTHSNMFTSYDNFKKTAEEDDRN